MYLKGIFIFMVVTLYNFNLVIAQVGDESSMSFEEVLGQGGSSYHPFISFAFTSTDNVYATRDDRKSDFYTVTTPGIWFAYPKVHDQLISQSTSSSAPGGLSGSRVKADYFKRFQTYLYYSTGIRQYNSETDNDTQNQTLEGIFEYNLKGGLFFDFLTVFRNDRGLLDLDSNSHLDSYLSRLLSFSIYYDLSDLMGFRLDTSSFVVDYYDTLSDILDRTDNSIILTVFSEITTKTSLNFVIRNIEIKYDNTSANDSLQSQYSAGLTMQMSEESSGSINLGQSIKQFTDPTISEASTITLALSGAYSISDSSSISISVGRKTEETSQAFYNYVVTQNMSLE
ncbi:MAG: hypothetical protein GY786_20035, partial [Proteobacteria bacterium]|nr:hypothetical protein [Pseudomonadota bacterium]